MKDKTSAALMAFFLGGVGGHKFYLGQTGLGIVYLVFCWTFIPAFASFIEGIMLLTMSQQAFDLRFNQGMSPQLMAPQNIVVNVANNSALAAGGTDVASQLKQLHELKIAGALTEDEFTEQKHKLLTGRTS